MVGLWLSGTSRPRGWTSANIVLILTFDPVQIAGFSGRTTLVDNNTWNNTHIATVGKVMSSREEVSYPILKKHDVDYVLIIFGGLIGFSGDDINKYLWMIRIAQGVWPDEVKESDFFTPRGEYKVDDQATPTMRESLMYKMSYYR